MEKLLILTLVFVLSLAAVSGDENGGDPLVVIAVQELDLVAGSGGISAHLAPDGEQFAHIDQAESLICIYATDGKGHRCRELADDDIRSIDTESVRWSPDGRYLLLTEESSRSLDSDLWIMDTITGELTNITDDGVLRLRGRDAGDWQDLDVAPHWLSDNRILFLRYQRPEDVILAPAIHTIALDGSGLEHLGGIPTDQELPVTALDVAPGETQIAYAYWADGDEADPALNGIWISDLNGENPRQLFPIEAGEAPPATLTFSPDGRYLLAIISPATRGNRPNDNWFYVVSVETGERRLLPEGLRARQAGWSPSGSALAYIISNPPPDEASGLYLSAEPGDPGRLVLPGHFNTPTLRHDAMLAWAANNVILLSSPLIFDEHKLVVVQLGLEGSE